MKRVSKSRIAVRLSDGVVNLTLLNFPTDADAGDERGKDFVGLHHLGFWVDDVKETETKIENAGGKYLMGRPEADAPTTFYEIKYRDPNGVIIDVTHLGWGGAVKDVVPREEAKKEKV